MAVSLNTSFFDFLVFRVPLNPRQSDKVIGGRPGVSRYEKIRRSRVTKLLGSERMTGEQWRGWDKMGLGVPSGRLGS